MLSANESNPGDRVVDFIKAVTELAFRTTHPAEIESQNTPVTLDEGIPDCNEKRRFHRALHSGMCMTDHKAGTRLRHPVELRLQT